MAGSTRPCGSAPSGACARSAEAPKGRIAMRWFWPVACLTAAAVAATDFEVEERETIQRTYALTAGTGTRQVKIDNLDGRVEVEGTDGAEVAFAVERTLQAESKEHL